MIKAEIELIIKWSENCVLTEKATREQKAAVPAQGGNLAQDAVAAVNVPSDLKFKVTDYKLYVPVVTLQTEYENKMYEKLKTGITIDFTWNKYRSQMINQSATNNLNYLIDPTFNNVHRLFVLAFENEEDRSSFEKYYTPTVEMKDYNGLIDGQEPFYEIPIKNKEETYKAITELIRDGNFTTGNLLDYKYFSTWYKLIAIDLSKQKSDLKNQKINFIDKLESQKIIKLLEQSDEDYLKFQTKSWYIINDQNSGQYGKGNENDPTIKFSTEIVKSFLIDYSDAYILVTGDIVAIAGNEDTKVAFRNCSPFVKCITHLNNEYINTADNLDLIQNIYNILDYSDDYADTTGSLYHYKRSE